eukprot:scaffold63183_cov62-Phaeocystis_antarctica.AAC.6
MLHQTPKNYGSLGYDKRSPQKKATVTKFKGAPLLKWLVAFCVLNGVAAYEFDAIASLSPEAAPEYTCGCSAEIDLMRSQLWTQFGAMLEAKLEGMSERQDELVQQLQDMSGRQDELVQQLTDVRQCSG